LEIKLEKRRRIFINGIKLRKSHTTFHVMWDFLNLMPLGFLSAVFLCR